MIASLVLRKNTDLLTSLIFIKQNPIEKIEEYIAHRNQREEQILATLEKQSGKYITAMEIVKLVYTVSLSIIRIYS